MTHVAVVLAGCGHIDGSEIQETIMTLLSLQQQGATYQCLAPNRDQYCVVNHLTGETVATERRNIMVEASRICRGDIKDLAKSSPTDYDAIIFPGGNGTAKNFFDLELKGKDYQVSDDILTFAKSVYQAGKPMGFVCIAPMLMPFIYPEAVKMTIGDNSDIAAIAEAKGACHISCAVDDIVVDHRHQAVSTPAYMLADNIGQIYAGVSKLVSQVLAFAS